MKALRNILIILSLAVGALLVVLSALLQLDDGSAVTRTWVKDHVNDIGHHDDTEIDVFHIYSDLNNINDDDRSEERFYERRNSSHRYGLTRFNNTMSSRASKRQPSNATKGKPVPAWDLVRTKQVLEFVHITKTGGSAVEKAGAEAGFKWGVCHFSKNAGFGRGCKRPDWVRPFGETLQLRDDIPVRHFRGEQWHTPPPWILNNPYQGRTTFTIVRDPYERVVSEFYCPFFGYYRPDTNPEFLGSRRRKRGSKATTRKYSKNTNKQSETLEELVERVFYRPENNDYFEDEGLPIEKELIAYRNPGSSRRRLQEKSKPISMPKPTRLIFNRWIRRAVKDLNPITGHMLPQHYYVYDNFNGSEKVVDHILHYERLEDEFPVLMNRYGITRVKLPRFHSQQLDLAGNPRWTVADLDPRTIRYINWRYDQDFQRFGYTKRTG